MAVTISPARAVVPTTQQPWRSSPPTDRRVGVVCQTLALPWFYMGVLTWGLLSATRHISLLLGMQ
jgi:hypothetical protein